MTTATTPAPPAVGALRARLRREGIDEAALGPDPLAAFRSWHAVWVATGPFDPMAATLATVDTEGRPSLRVMDLVTVDHGFVFVTHGESRKAMEMEAHPHVALCFAWLEIGRHVRVGGRVERLTGAEADAAFLALPASIRLVASATRQSDVIRDRADLQRLLDDARSRHQGGEIGRPDGWAGFRCVPREMEFWQQRPDDLQDRIHYRRAASDGAWSVERLSP
ncbi:pyridoxamine 5'-phosphate oxidase [Azospirillum sp. RWY-5-1]|uniref:Pyridoxamine 5'-phosphate oxidase n=1 Tax=Azospirillum oleiclasticum TaxID=2735135 RepID=A0ABX2TJR7_9PROT|nr:pyridoxal 5'-phosphate synthase [Azospirillum oleiclasticum]NYZ14606.1 pyridoxamine 5'-phosphate oxidase [Azospirillum oleiclasticum]NYZ24384.1 pyridoxamine 5'-phosphate oxidase [Azospirillum oleiclasticum]